MNYRWPTKLKKFGIVDPILRFFVAKYEGIIPWNKMRNSKDVEQHIEMYMMPRLLAKTRLNGKKNVYLSSLTYTEQTTAILRNAPDKESQQIAVLATNEGNDVAAKALINLINIRKKQVLDAWLKALTGKSSRYRKSYAFQYIVLAAILKLAPAKSRRTTISCSPSVVDWLYKGIKRGIVLPNENIADVYGCQLATKCGGFRNGWLHFSQEVDDYRYLASRRLATLCRDSGWCIASGHYASSYLEDGDFFILFQNNKPVVALRYVDDVIIECQGRYNQSPAGYFQQIEMFLLSLNIDLLSRRYESKMELEKTIPLDNQDEAFWNKRINEWPFLIDLAPTYIQQKMECHARYRAAILCYSYPSDLFQELFMERWSGLHQNDWLPIIRSNPRLYNTCRWKDEEAVKQACIHGWLNIVDKVEEFREIPSFVLNTESFRQQSLYLKLHMLSKKPRSFKERVSPFPLSDLFPDGVTLWPDELELVLMAYLLRVRDGNYDDSIFPAMIRERADFATLREGAWRHAVAACPPIIFAVPEDLKQKEGLMILREVKTRANITQWVEKITDRPWILERKTGVPVSIRRHRKLLNAYVDGWLIRMHKYPYRLWAKIPQSRVYMCSALLSNRRFIEAWRRIWTSSGGNIRKWWLRASPRMKQMPIFRSVVLTSVERVILMTIRSQSKDDLHQTLDSFLLLSPELHVWQKISRLKTMI